MMKQKQSNVLYVYIYRYIYVKYIHSHDLMQNSIGGGGNKTSVVKGRNTLLSYHLISQKFMFTVRTLQLFCRLVECSEALF